MAKNSESDIKRCNPYSYLNYYFSATALCIVVKVKSSGILQKRSSDRLYARNEHVFCSHYLSYSITLNCDSTQQLDDDRLRPLFNLPLRNAFGKKIV